MQKYLDGVSILDVKQKLFNFSYAQILDRLRECLAFIGPESQLFGIHSFRRGGSQYLRELNLPDNFIKEQGRWHSDCYHEYLSFNSKNTSHAAKSSIEQFKNKFLKISPKTF